jgi:hypothetical protein
LAEPVPINPAPSDEPAAKYTPQAAQDSILESIRKSDRHH